MKFTLDWTLIQMLLTQKLTMYCFDIHDGTIPIDVRGLPRSVCVGDHKSDAFTLVQTSKFTTHMQSTTGLIKGHLYWNILVMFISFHSF